MTELARRRLAAAAAGLAVTGLLAAGCGDDGSTSSAQGGKGSTTTTQPVIDPGDGGHYDPHIDPADFVATVDNPLWPLKPGTAYRYEGTRGTTRQRDDEVVTHQTRQILGIDATVVRDTVSQHGHPIERTLDFYAQDKQGNVWYLGEYSFELRNGRFVRASDSWRSGVDGAEPGIIMPAHPRPGDRYRQEYYPPGEALDEAHVLGTRGPVTVPYGRFRQVLVTSERSPLEPQTEHKYYAPGVGEIAERVVKGHHEEFKLVRVTH